MAEACADFCRRAAPYDWRQGLTGEASQTVLDRDEAWPYSTRVVGWALTAMGTSMQLVWNNLGPTLAWGAMVLLLFAACVVTGLAGMIIIFPLLGHATWHAYRAVAPAEIWE